MLTRILRRLGLEARIDGTCCRGLGVWIDDVDPGLVFLIWSRELRIQRLPQARQDRARASARRALARFEAAERRGAA